MLQEELETQQLQHIQWCNSTKHSDYIAWGEAASGDLVVDPGLWSIDNFGDKVIALNS